MVAAVNFYEALGFRSFTEDLRRRSPAFGSARLPQPATRSRRADGPAQLGTGVLWVDDVDAMYQRVLDAGFSPLPRRRTRRGGTILHVHDTDGHELSFARPLASP